MYVRRGLELGFLCVSVASGLGGGPGAIAGSTSALASGEGGDRFDCGVGFKFAAGLWQGLGATSGAASGEGGGSGSSSDGNSRAGGRGGPKAALGGRAGCDGGFGREAITRGQTARVRRRCS